MAVNFELDKALSDHERAYLERVAQIIPVLRQHAQDAESARRLPAEVVQAAQDVSLFSALVPVAWGGQGLGLRALTEAARVLSHGDASSAWALAFLIEHNWMACRMPMSAQKELFSGRDHVLAAAPLVPGGTATKLPDGSYSISGTWRYATGFDNSEWVFVTCSVDESGQKVDRAFLLPVESVDVVQRWEASGMAATSSHNVTGADIVVPADRSIPIPEFTSADRHGGVAHQEAIYHYPLHFGLNNMMAAIFVGIAEAVLDLYEQKLESSRPFGLARRERTPSRIRWGAARTRIAAARLLYLDTLAKTIEKCEGTNVHTQEDIGELQISSLVIAHMCHDAVNELCKGIGSGAFALNDPIQRYKRDIDVLINHAGMDWDVVADRATRWVMGFDAATTDWHSAPAGPRSPAWRTAQGGAERLVQALFAGDAVAAQDALGDGARLDAPRFEPAQEPTDIASLARRWPEEYGVRLVDTRVLKVTMSEAGVVTEIRTTLNDGAKELLLPIAVVESLDHGSPLVRLYHSERLITGKRLGRRPIWPAEADAEPTPFSEAHPAVAAYMRSIATGDAEEVMARFASGGKLDNGVRPVVAPEELRRIFQAMVRTGGARLIRRNEFDDGTTVGFEYTGLPRPATAGEAPRTPPGGGIGVYDYDSAGLITAVRMYDDFDPEALLGSSLPSSSAEDFAASRVGE